MHNFICCADLHIHSKVPSSRKGDYLEQILNKFEFILNETNKTDSKILVAAGDIFDSPTVAYRVTRSVLEIIKKYPITILVVQGQHDIRFHTSGLDNTPLGILQSANAITILSNKEKLVLNDISFIGSGWNEEPEDEADVLVTHRMVVKKDPLWFGQTNYSSAHAILRKYPWAQCIISGDNHAPHLLKIKSGKLQINCGSMVRSTKSQINFEPRIYSVNCNNWKAKAIKIPCLPAEEVFDLNKIVIEESKDESKKIAKEKIAEFINTLPKNDQEKPNFKKILQNVVEQISPNEDVKNIINSTMERIS